MRPGTNARIGNAPTSQRHREAVAEPQRFDALIDARELELFFEPQRAVRVAQRGAEQIGEILDGFLGALRVAARQRRDRVHAVEQEVRPDARLQRLDARARFGAHVLLPLMRDEEVAQQQRRDDASQMPALRSRNGQWSLGQLR